MILAPPSSPKCTLRGPIFHSLVRAFGGGGHRPVGVFSEPATRRIQVENPARGGSSPVGQRYVAARAPILDSAEASRSAPCCQDMPNFHRAPALHFESTLQLADERVLDQRVGVRRGLDASGSP